MKQVAQNYRSGELVVLDVPPPACAPGGVLVRSLYSLISAGTELMKVNESKMSLIGMARARPEQAKKVLDTVAQQGPVSAYRKAMNRLDSYTPLGYSLAGVVEAVGKGAEELSVGQVVACAGNEFALHAELNWVPVNLCVPVPDGVAPQLAAFSTVGAIALQGVRQAEVQLGDIACVIGLGLVGQLVVELLVASGARVFGFDVVPERCRLAEKIGAIACGLARRGRRGYHRGRRRRGFRRVRCRPGVPGRRGVVQRSGRDGRPDRPRPGHHRGHRQVQAGPALERLLREGARPSGSPAPMGRDATTSATR